MVVARRSLCYVVSHFSEAGHTAHLSRFLQKVAESVDVYVIVWSHDTQPSFVGAKEVHLLRDRAANRLVRILVLTRLARSLSRSGCRVFFVRIAHHVAGVLGLLKKPLGIRVFFWHSGMAKESKPAWKPSVKASWARIRWFLNDLLLTLSLRLVSVLVTGPDSMARYYAERYHLPMSRIRILSNELDVTAVHALGASKLERHAIRRRLGIPGDGRLLLYSGGLSEFRLGSGGNSLIDPLQLILEAHPDIRLVLAGERDLPAIEAWAGQTRFQERIHVLGPIPFEDLAVLAATSHIFVFPVAAAGFPRVLLEAMALDLPFVAYDAGGVRDVVGTALREQVVESGRADEFADRVAALLRSEAKRRSAIMKGRERVSGYDVGRVSEEFLELLGL